MELGPRNEQVIPVGLENEVGVERWTRLDRSLRDISDEGGGVTDLRPGGTNEKPSYAGRCLAAPRNSRASVWPNKWAPVDLETRP
jgi:hypothetical protein